MASLYGVSNQKSSNAYCGRFSGSDPQRVGSKVTPSSNSWIPMVVTWIPSLEAQIEIFEVWKAPSIAVCTRGGVRVSADCVQWCLWRTLICYFFFQIRTLPVQRHQCFRKKPINLLPLWWSRFYPCLARHWKLAWSWPTNSLPIAAFQTRSYAWQHHVSQWT